MLASSLKTLDFELGVKLNEQDRLKLRWHAAIQSGAALPRYEELALEGMGHISNQIALLRCLHEDDFEILRAGALFETWLGTSDSGGTRVRNLRPDCCFALQKVAGPALRNGTPSKTTMHQVNDGVVSAFDLLALPVSNRWGPPMLLLFLEEHERRYNLVDTIFQATDEGMMALTAVRG